ncbi:hypothetical protein GCM10009090_15070 [[Pseudomonas] boreopolis]|uniref:Uncharacterized protein n=1 Tax=Xanthomonas boreopolis TaxID=86183 RepID=A0A919KI59_9XANT|nr:hypothetical protein GCM10009090_15070 [[Pseudomonas] boreopolis]
MNAPAISAAMKPPVRPSAHQSGFSWRIVLGAWLWSCPIVLALLDARTLCAAASGDYYTLDARLGHRCMSRAGQARPVYGDATSLTTLEKSSLPLPARLFMA